MTIDKDYPGDLRRSGDAWWIDLWYPDREGKPGGNPRAIEIDLIHVRAADGLRIEYDFDRDGWIIKQQPTCERGFTCHSCQSREGHDQWKEVAFVKAWGRVVSHVDISPEDATP